MKRVLKLIISLIIIAIIVIIVIIYLSQKENIGEEEYTIKVEEIEELAIRNKKIHQETSRNKFYIIKGCIEKFYQNYQLMNRENLNEKMMEDEESLDELLKKYQERTYSMLDNEYIRYKNITIDNINEKLENIKESVIIIDKVYTKDLDNSSYVHFVEARIKEKEKDIKKVKLIVRLSSANTFKIFLDDYLIENNFYDFSKDIDVTQICKEEISNNEYNTYNTTAITTKTYIEDLFKHFRSSYINDIEYTYELIDETYREIRFKDKEEYMQYIKNSQLNMVKTSLHSYNQNTINGVNHYLCKDNNDRYYIFKETAPFQYTVILDNYTIPTDEFTSEYKNQTDAKKVVLNIKRFFMGIDDKNYGYSYSVLSESFKTNKYPTKEEFVAYANKNFFEENEIEYITYKKENGGYIYKIKIKDATGKSKEEKTLNIIMKLKTGTDFEMSFGE